ncbi:MAG: hypothetical protein WBB65_12495 [Anaerolineales bacterium]
MLTIFSAPKPFSDPHIARIQRNAITSWLKLGEEVEILLIGDEPGLAEVGVEFGVKVLRDVERNEEGTPLISSIFKLASSESRHPFLCYTNADILLFEDLIDAVQQFSFRFNDFLILGQRWDLDLERELAFGEGWQRRLMEEVHSRGRRHPPTGSDYFIFRKELFQDIPDFALGRAGWDNWMIYAGRRAGFPIVDASEAITVVHQNHDYQHLPGGQPHYQLPESRENVKMAGGAETVFTIRDATWKFDMNGVRKKYLIESDPLRWIESSLLCMFGPGRISRAIRMLFHPLGIWKYLVSRSKKN